MVFTFSPYLSGILFVNFARQLSHWFKLILNHALNTNNSRAFHNSKPCVGDLARPFKKLCSFTLAQFTFLPLLVCDGIRVGKRDDSVRQKDGGLHGRCMILR